MEAETSVGDDKIGRFTRCKINYYVSVCVLILMAMWISGYIFLCNSGDYSFALGYIESNPTVSDMIGNITLARPGFVNFKRHYSGGHATSKFDVVLRGEKNSGVVHLNLEGSEQGWTVKEASLEIEDGTINLLDQR